MYYIVFIVVIVIIIVVVIIIFVGKASFTFGRLNYTWKDTVCQQEQR